MSNKAVDQLTLWMPGGTLDSAVTNVFMQKPVVNSKTGLVIGTRFAVGKRKAVAESLQLEGKANADKLNKEILKARDIAYKQLLRDIQAMGDKLTLNTFTHRTRKDGGTRLAISLDTVERPDAVLNAIEILHDMGKLDDRQYESMKAAHLKAKEAVNVTSSVVAPAQLPAAAAA